MVSLDILSAPTTEFLSFCIDRRPLQLSRSVNRSLGLLLLQSI